MRFSIDTHHKTLNLILCEWKFLIRSTNHFAPTPFASQEQSAEFSENEEKDLISPSESSFYKIQYLLFTLHVLASLHSSGELNPSKWRQHFRSKRRIPTNQWRRRHVSEEQGPQIYFRMLNLTSVLQYACTLNKALLYTDSASLMQS